MSQRLRIAIIGGGPAGLMAADTLAGHADVDLYEHGRNIGRKFLVAGQGGFNLTNEAEGDDLLRAYRPAGFLDEALTGFGPSHLREWLRDRGIETFIGSSGRVFPMKGMRPIDVLTRIRERLVQRGVRIHVEHVFTGFDPTANVRMEHAEGPFTLEVDRVLFALGGASWPVTGSTGIWPPLFRSLGVEVRPFRSSNCGVELPWPEAFIGAHQGKPLKNIHVRAADLSAHGEAVITSSGLEGNAIYAVVPAIRDGADSLTLDLRPESTVEGLFARIEGKEPRNFGKALHLGRERSALIKAFTTKDVNASPMLFAEHVKALPLPVLGLRPLDEAISSVGGIRTEDLENDFSLRGHPHLFAIGEMVDWDAPTGGYLLQACFAMGRHAARSLLRRSL